MSPIVGLAGIGAQQAGDDREERRFTGPVGPEDGDGLGRSEAEGDLEAPCGKGCVQLKGHRECPFRCHAKARAPVGEPDDGHRHGDQQEGERDGGVGVGFALQIDLQRQGAGDALQAAGEGQGGTEFAQAAGEGQNGAGGQAGEHQRDGHPAQHRARARPEGRGDRLVLVAGGAQGAFEADHQERQGNEGLGEDDGGGGEGDLDSGQFQAFAQESLAAEGVEQGDASHHGRQDQRQQDEGPEQALARERAPGQDECERHAEDDAGGGARRGGAQAQAERGE